MNRPDLRALCDALQTDLRLRDWRVDVAYVPDLANQYGDPVHGLCSHLVDAKQARIAIRDPQTPITESDPSVEEVLIHELVHLHFAPLSGDTRAEVAAEEQAVWSLSEALASARTDARRAQIARAMRAGVDRARRQRGPLAAPTERSMDPVLLAALMAAASNEDPAAAVAQIKELLSQLQSTSAPESEPPMSADAPPAAPGEDPQKPPMQAAPAPAQDPAKCAKPAPHAVAPVARQAAPAASAKPAGDFVTRAELDRLQASQHLAQHGAHLTEAQRSFASALTLDGVKRFIAALPAPTASDKTQAAGQRRTAPTQGGDRGVSRLSDAERTEMRRRMGLAAETGGVRRVGRAMVFSALTHNDIRAAQAAQKGDAR